MPALTCTTGFSPWARLRHGDKHGDAAEQPDEMGCSKGGGRKETPLEAQSLAGGCNESELGGREPQTHFVLITLSSREPESAVQ